MIIVLTNLEDVTTAQETQRLPDDCPHCISPNAIGAPITADKTFDREISDVVSGNQYWVGRAQPAGLTGFLNSTYHIRFKWAKKSFKVNLKLTADVIVNNKNHMTII